MRSMGERDDHIPLMRLLDSRPLEENLPGSVDSSQIPNLFANHGNRVAVNHSSAPMQQPVAAKKTMLPMAPQEVLNQPSKLTSPQNLNDLNPNANGNTGRKYQCKMCPQIFGSKADLQLHTQMHMRDAKPYKCSQCSKTFANSSYLSQHTRIHLGIKPYRCEICHRKFTQLSHLQQHIRTHTGDKPYKCRHPNCNKAFSQLSNLQSHSRCHQTDKPFKCNSCYKCFSDEASLLEHIPRHKESKHLKTHICQFCGKSYTQETYLSKHMQKHADRFQKHSMMNSLVIGASMASTASVAHLAPDSLWHKAISAKVIENTSTNVTGSSVAAMAAVVASTQRKDMNSDLQAQLAEFSRLSAASREEQENRMSNCERNEPSANDNLASSQSHYESSPPTSTINKSSSAFTPIQSALLPIAGAGNQINISNASRTFLSYDSINLTKASTSPSVDVKPLHSSFPNQLISLRQIRSYASMPSISSVEHPISLKSKGPH